VTVPQLYLNLTYDKTYYNQVNIWLSQIVKYEICSFN